MPHASTAWASPGCYGSLAASEGLSLPEILRLLVEKGQAPLALMVDEGQHALTTEAGESTMAALKSARDQLNRPDSVALMLVMSGSDRDKLLRLVNTNGAPFYGSQIQHMPELDRAFIEHLARRIEAQQPALAPVDRSHLYDAFAAFGLRPQFLMEAIGQALNQLAEPTGRFEQQVQEAAAAHQAQETAQMEADWLALRQRTPALVWKSARGEYAVQDAGMHRWYTARSEAGQWPLQGG